MRSTLEDPPDSAYRRRAQDDLERDAHRPHDHGDERQDDVLEQDAERKQDDAERRERVQSRERRREERARRAANHQQPEHDVARAVVEEEAESRLREALESADELQQR